MSQLLFTQVTHNKLTGIKKQAGLTLEELLIVVGIVATLSSLIPSMLYAMTRANHVTTTVNRLSHDLMLTRSEAIRSNEQYVICKSDDGVICTRNKSGWEQGWIIYQDSNHNRKREADENVVSYQPKLDNDVEIDYRAFGSKHYVTYRPTGWTRTNGTFHICGDAKGKFAKAIILYKTGRARLSSKSGSKKPDCSRYSS